MGFSTVKVNVPDVQMVFKSGNTNYGDPVNKKNNVATLKRISNQYGTSINQWGELLSIPNGVIMGFIATESSGVMVGPNKFEATGLMQATPGSFYDAVVSWSKEVDTAMPAAVAQELRSKAPYLMQRPAQSLSSCKANILNILKTDASFNILAGCMVLRWMFERFSNNGTALFNRALIAYNAGAYTSSQLSENPAESKKLVPNTSMADTLSLVTNSRVPQESKYYLVKMLGVDGFLDLIYNQKLL